MRRQQAEGAGIRRISDLAAHAPRLVIGGDYEFFGRPEWTAVQATYRLVLEDDRGAIPPYDAVILAGPRLVRERPDVVAALEQLTATINADRMRRMNLAVDQDGASPVAVAEALLRDIRGERLGR